MTEVSQLLQKLQTICVSGVDALKLMQGQFTADLSKLLNGQSIYSAYCDVKGKVGWFFLVNYQNDQYYLTMLAEILPSFLLEFKKYAVFSLATISESNVDLGVAFNEQQDIYNKIPQIYLATQFKYFPHDLRLQELNALSFTKGCFKGQEIIARMEHRGSIKRRTYVLTHNLPVTIGAPVIALEQEVGSIVRTCGNVSLAVLNESFLSENLSINGQLVTRL